MESDVIMMAQLAEVDMICDKCKAEISIGQDYYYDHHEEEVYCENCVGNNPDY